MIVVGGIFGALRFNRENSKAIVETQSTVLQDMKALNTELSDAAKRIRLERDDLLARIELCAVQVKQLHSQIASLEAQVKSLEGQIEGLRHDLKGQV